VARAPVHASSATFIDRLLEDGLEPAALPPTPAQPDPPRQILIALIRRFRPRDRRILVRHFLRRRTINETARRIGVSPGQVRRGVRRIHPRRDKCAKITTLDFDSTVDPVHGKPQLWLFLAQTGA